MLECITVVQRREPVPKQPSKGTVIVDAQPQEPKQPAFSFMSMVKKSAELPKTSRSKLTDPLSVAKEKVIAALKVQIDYAQMVLVDQPLPTKTVDGKPRTVSTWFSKQDDGWWTSIRYGQQAIKINGQPDHLIGKLGDVHRFYDAVIEAVEKGELDAQIGTLQAEKSAALRGK